MARIVLTTLGSRGDLNPFLALALGLRTRGHEVLFAVEQNFRQAVMEAGFPVHLLPGDIDAVFAAYPRQIFGSSLPLLTARLLIEKHVLPTAAATIEELRAACAEADLFVSTAHQVLASTVADLVQAPWVTIALTPATIPSTSIAPLPALGALPDFLRPLIYRSSWAAGMASLRPVVDAPINRLRAHYMLPPRHNLFFGGNLSHTLTAVIISPAFVSSPADWPSSIRQTGFCFWDTPAAWDEPGELSLFLQEAQPVVVVSSGSMSLLLRDAFASFYQTSISAIRQVGARALVIGAPPGLLPASLPKEVYALPFAPFSQIYPRCAVAIHHGGIGTVAQTLRAGIPVLVTPWGVDQFFAAAQVEQIGAGRYLSRRAYTTVRVAKALDELLHDRQYHERSRAIADQITREDGVATLCDALEAVLSKSELSPS